MGNRRWECAGSARAREPRRRRLTRGRRASLGTQSVKHLDCIFAQWRPDLVIVEERPFAFQQVLLALGTSGYLDQLTHRLGLRVHRVEFLADFSRPTPQVETLNLGDYLGQRKDPAAGVYTNRLNEDLKRQFAVPLSSIPPGPLLRLCFGRELSRPPLTETSPWPSLVRAP